MQILTDSEKKELKAHGSFSFPVLISEEILSSYEGKYFNCHWHPEIELTYVESGEMLYQINDREYHIHAGQALFGNANTLHAGKSSKDNDCHYLSITFDPKLIYGFEHSLIQERYVTPLLCHPQLSSIFFDLSKPWHKEIISHIKKMGRQKQQTCTELSIQIALLSFWQLLLQNMPEVLKPHSLREDKDNLRIKTIMTFIEDNYDKKLELKQIAAQIHLCESECCRLFKRYMHQSLFDYLLSYRIKKSLPLLSGTSLSITEIASLCGFSDSNYYAKVFHRYQKCSPSAYRKSQH